MPTYEYECDSCGRFEAFQSMKDEALKTCPTCGGNARRLISAGGGLIFKGSGFYITDYRKPEYEKQKKEEQGKTADAKPSGGESGEKKPGGGEKTPESPSKTSDSAPATKKPETKPPAAGSSGETGS